MKNLVLTIYRSNITYETHYIRHTARIWRLSILTLRSRVKVCGLKFQPTSPEIAEVTGKPHNDVLKAIRKMEQAWEKIHGSKFRLMFREVNIGTKGRPDSGPPWRKTENHRHQREWSLLSHPLIEVGTGEGVQALGDLYGWPSTWEGFVTMTFERLKFLETLARKPGQLGFLKGWKNRVAYMTYEN